MVTECWTLSAWTVPGQELGRRDEHRASETSIGVRKLFAAGNWRYPFGQRLVEVTWTGCRVRPDAATIQGMARVRSGQASPDPCLLIGVSTETSGASVTSRVRSRTLGGPSPDLSPARTLVILPRD